MEYVEVERCRPGLPCPLTCKKSLDRTANSGGPAEAHELRSCTLTSVPKHHDTLAEDKYSPWAAKPLPAVSRKSKTRWTSSGVLQ